MVEADPGNTNYHLVGPVNLHLIGLTAGALCLLCLLLLYVIRKRRLARTQDFTETLLSQIKARSLD